MYFLISKRTGRESAEAAEAEFQADSLTLGSDKNALVQIVGVKGSVEIKRLSGGDWQIAAKRAQLTVNEKLTNKAVLATGDSFEFGGYRFDVVAAPTGFDFALDQTATSSSPAAFLREGIDLQGSIWNVRRLSWTLLSVVLVLFLLIPVGGMLSSEFASVLRQTPLPDDSVWSSGPLAAAHQTAGISDDCQACHVEPFKMVKDDTCLDCHRNLREHADVTLHETDVFTGERCGSCHREHNEPPHIVNRDNGLCVDCHAQPDSWVTSMTSPVGAVTAFTEAAHPEFRRSLLTPQGPGGAHGWTVNRVRPGEGELAEASNLKFTHTVHLDIDKVQEPQSGEALQCASCHSLKDDGEHFEPVSMDQHCRSCHSLSFDVFEPDIELPHGNLREAIVAMEAHFIREFTDPVLRKQRAASKPRRVPGKREGLASCQGTGLDCGRAEALKEAQYQFEETGCITCHEVLNTGLADISDRWFVQPVKITDDWYPKSRFDHVSHLSLAGEEGEVCGSCHEASTSEKASDVLIPGQDNCLTCHSQDKGFSAVDCVGCHAFHQSDGSRSVLVRGELNQ
jgi:predicted CXXCH cytochrome family protein